jgi:hypothetical protein
LVTTVVEAADAFGMSYGPDAISRVRNGRKPPIRE